MILLQHDRRPLLLREQGHGAFDGTRQVLARHQIFNRFRRLGGRRQLHQIDILRRLHDRSAALATHPVTAQIQRDPI